MRDEEKDIEFIERDFNLLEIEAKLTLEQCKSILCEKEIKHKEKIIFESINKSRIIKNIHEEYSSRMHELKAFLFFKKLGVIKISNDYKHEKGPDFNYNNHYIECVVPTVGEGKNFKELKKSKFEVYNTHFDYSERARQIIIRFTSSLYSKVKNYNSWGNSYQPFCIFMHLGRFTNQFHEGEYFIEMNRFLVGLGDLTIKYNSKKDRIETVSYSIKENIKNNNNSDVSTLFFNEQSTNMVSAVIISTAAIDEEYSRKNTIIFKNFNATNQIINKDFHDFIIWEFAEPNRYIPTRNGKELSLSRMKII